MKNKCQKYIILFLLPLLFQTNIYALVTNQDNKNIIENFRSKYNISQYSKTKHYDEKFISNMHKVKRALLDMAEVDQKARTEVWEKVAQNCQMENLDCANDYNQVDALITEIDAANINVLKLFMQKYPWFKISQFGKDGAEAAWLIVQHSNDIDLKTKTLFIMEGLLSSGEADKQSYALLYDRVSLEYKEFGLKQRFGSQFSLSEDRKKLIFEPCDGDLNQIEARRKEFGLPPLKDNAKMLVKMNSITEVVGLDLK